jgi:hypothetical protein
MIQYLLEPDDREDLGQVDDGPCHGGDGNSVLDRTVRPLQSGHDVDLHRRDKDPPADHGDVDLAVSPRETVGLCRSPVGGQRPATGGKACRKDSLLVGDPRAGNPIDTRVDPQPDCGVQPSPDVAVRQSAGKCLRTGEQAMLLLRHEMNVLHTSI